MKNRAKLLSFCVFFILFIACSAFAQQKTYKVGGATPHNTVPPSGSQKTQQFKFPKPEGYVNDYEGDLDSATIKTLTRIASQHRKKTKEEVIVVTIPTYAPFKDLTEYVKALTDAWGVGEHGKNTGVLVVFSKTQRQMRIGVGTGLYNKLTESMSQKIINEKMLPFFKQNKYSEGLIAGTKELVKILEGA
ncbi:MAG TPA: TPM domain-containing protein [Candidatus Kapabacteria bacterium]|nr:TPM domain-containing protein [Candidatus Kapabacteria bacterium]